MRRLLILLLAGSLLAGCGVNSHSYYPGKKYSPEQLQKDYSVYQQTLEEAHPGLYWYTSKDSMDLYFRQGRSMLNDSLSEPDFRKILSWVASKIGCGHTSVRASKAYTKYYDTARIARIFPLSLKLWDDTAVIAANLNRRDSMLRRGTVITKINGRPMKVIVDSLFNYISTDGYNTTHKYQSLSNRGFFGALYSSVYGFSDNTRILQVLCKQERSDPITREGTPPVCLPCDQLPVLRNLHAGTGKICNVIPFVY